MLNLLATLTLLMPAFTALAAGKSIFLMQNTGARNTFAMAITTGGMLLCTLFSWILFFQIAINNAQPLNIHLWDWLTVGDLNLGFGLLVDKLTAVMLIVVTTVSFCVHLYSYEYMKDDPSKPRFFAYLSFFTFAMLALVTAPNLLQMFLGWEGVGVASYLLIGYYTKKASANAASIKAFVTNRVADAFLLLGLFTLVLATGSLDYADILPQAETLAAQTFTFLGFNFNLVELAALFLFLGAMGKSAQFGFHVWLPDAMEGPTPVSALIHAATMVTAGVFLLCRMSPLFEFAPHVLTFVAYVGALTAIFAATVGLTQTDIKRVIAYSTCSQLGYMFFAIGVSAYPAAMFHLTTHAFFKALLFLGAGAIIHALHHEQNLFKMGALKTVLPTTYVLMWIGSLALAGIPPFAGFFSKDLILESAFGAHNNTGYLLYTLGTIGAFLTAFYSFRLLFLAFHQEHKGNMKYYIQAQADKTEGGWKMQVPLIILAVGAVLSGYVLKKMGYEDWWQGSIFIKEGNDALYNAHKTHWLPKYFPLVVALSGILLAVYFYLKNTTLPHRLAVAAKLPYAVSLHKWYIDELYSLIILKPFNTLSNLSKVLDKAGIDAWIPHGGSKAAAALGKIGQKAQSGLVYHYAFIAAAGLCLLLLYVLYGGGA